MSASQPGVFNVQQFADAGAPLVNGRLYTYAQGTTTHKDAYTDAAGTIPHTYTGDGAGGQYIALNSRGELVAPLYLASGAYDLALKRSDGSAIWTRRADGIESSANTLRADLGEPTGAEMVGRGAGTVETALVALENKAGEIVTSADSGGARKVVLKTTLRNTAVGEDALTSDDSDGLNVAVGNGAAKHLKQTAGEPLQRGVGNTVVGTDALSAPGASCDYATAFGYAALASNTSGYCNVAIGLRTLTANTTGTYNTALGTDALMSAITPNENTALGAKAMLLTTTGALNTAVGSSALYHNNAPENTAVGVLASYENTIGQRNVSVGSRANEKNVVGSGNTAIGYWALRLAGASGNTAVGDRALGGTTTGQDNVAVGAGAMANNDTGSGSVAMGQEAANFGVAASSTVAIGYRALYTATAGLNTAVGHSAGIATTTGNLNCFVGRQAGQANTTGQANTAVGDSALSESVSYHFSTGLGYNAQVTGSNQIQLGDSSSTTYAYGAVQNRSDIRDKADVRDTTLGLDFIKALRPVDFRWDYRESYGWGEKDGSKKRSRFHHGLIAQEVKAVLDAQSVDFGGYQDHSLSGGKDVLSLGYDELIAPLIKSVQQLSEQNAALVARVAALEGEPAI